MSGTEQPEIVSKLEFSKLIGKSPAMVTKHVHRGLPLNKQGQVLVAEALQWLEDLGSLPPPPRKVRNKPRKKPAKKAAQSRSTTAPVEAEVEPEVETKADAERRKETALANKHELDYAQKKGALVSVAEVNAYVAGTIVQARDILLRMPGELRDRLAKESDPANIEAAIQVEVDRSLGRLSEFQHAE